MAKLNKPIYTDEEWSIPRMEKVFSAGLKIAEDKYKLDTYDNVFEIITSKRMIENYVTHGLPEFYTHWSFGKHFTQMWKQYNRAEMGLAYEIVINTNPCINYLMENNTMSLMSLTELHAGIGHNNFFKNNYLFQDNTQAGFIREYCAFADKFIKKCEYLYGNWAVEQVLDLAHMLSSSSLTFKRIKIKNFEEEQIDEYRKIWQRHLDGTKEDLDKISKENPVYRQVDKYIYKMSKNKHIYPLNDVLYFFEKLPTIPVWKREIFRVVRIINNYFFPQIMTKLNNEAWATTWHYTLCHDLWKNGDIPDFSWLNILESHTNVIAEPTTLRRDTSTTSFNPYWLGFNLYKDIKRACLEPVASDYKYLPHIAGNTDWLAVWKDAAYLNSDESLVRNYLSPTLMKKLKIAIARIDSNKDYIEIVGSHEEEHFETTRNNLADTYQLINKFPQLIIKDYDDSCSKLVMGYLPYKDRGLHSNRDRDWILGMIRLVTGLTVTWTGCN